MIMDGFRASTNVAADTSGGVVTASTSPSSFSDGNMDGDYSANKMKVHTVSKKVSDVSRDKDRDRAPVAEFLYQLIKMLEDDNKEIIEWSDARIKVHHPERLEAEVLSRYFRHSKFASFQRQLNYFGFRKIAGKGKMSPCSYVNEVATEDIKSLLNIKRKTNGSAARKAAMKQAMAANAAAVAGLDPLSLRIGALNGYPQGLPGGLQPGLTDSLFGIQLRHLQALQQKQQQQKALGEGFYFPSDNALNALIAAGQSRQSMDNLAQRFAATSHYRPLNGYSTSGVAPQPASVFSSGPASMAAANAAPATAAMNPSGNVMPATAAAAALGASNNLGSESNANLDSFVNDQQQQPQTKATAPRAGRVASQTLLNRLPSSNTIFPDNSSTASLTQLLSGQLGSANRLSSMLSLSGYLSREPSMLDLLGGAAAVTSQFPGVAPPVIPQSLAAFAPAPQMREPQSPSRVKRG